LRAFYIGLFYLTNKKYKESIGFCFKVDSYLKLIDADLPKIREGVKKASRSEQLDAAKLVYVDGQLSALRDELSQTKYKLQTAAFLDDGSTTVDDEESSGVDKKQLAKIPLCERWDIYFEDEGLAKGRPNIVRFPPEFEPIPCKPLFFDLALNYVELPSLEDKIDKKPAAQDNKSGVKGLFKGFFGFS
jgi:signal recognition particle subunit SRP68